MQCVYVFTGDPLAPGMSNLVYFRYNLHVAVLVYYGNWSQSLNLIYGKETYFFIKEIQIVV